MNKNAYCSIVFNSKKNGNHLNIHTIKVNGQGLDFG